MKNMIRIVDEEEFQLARVKFDRDFEGGKKALEVENLNINI